MPGDTTYPVSVKFASGTFTTKPILLCRRCDKNYRDASKVRDETTFGSQVAGVKRAFLSGMEIIPSPLLLT